MSLANTGVQIEICWHEIRIIIIAKVSTGL